MEATSHSAAALRRTVSLVCGLLDQQVPAVETAALTETDLRFELVSCLLGSQVRAESANAAAERLQAAGLLTDERWRKDDDAFENDVRCVLVNAGATEPSSSYRFPALRAHQLARVRARCHSRPLLDCLGGARDSNAARRALVDELPGIGPKQASMFLRNVGASFDLAILDVHVLRFLRLIEVLPDQPIRVAVLDGYERVEAVVRRYAESVGRAVGYLDWAIWITMRAAREVRT